jgi:hypothetical protein
MLNNIVCFSFADWPVWRIYEAMSGDNFSIDPEEGAQPGEREALLLDPADRLRRNFIRLNQRPSSSTVILLRRPKMNADFIANASLWQNMEAKLANGARWLAKKVAFLATCGAFCGGRSARQQMNGA